MKTYKPTSAGRRDSSVIDYKENLKNKILKANKELADIKFEYKTN